jgi:hypothetical protein
MFRKFLCRLGLHRYRLFGWAGCYSYFECQHCRRRTFTTIPGLVGPVDIEWLRGGEWASRDRPRIYKDAQ